MKLHILVGGDGGIYANCFAIRRPWLPFRSPADHSLLGSPPDFLAYARALSGSNPNDSDNANGEWLCHSPFALAETVGFEPTVPRRYTAFRVRLVITTSIRLLIPLCRRTDKSDFIIFSCLFQGLSDAADEILIVTLPERLFRCRH